MRKLIAGMKISLDGKVEPDDEHPHWVDAWSEDYGLTPQIDACLLGGNMYPDYERFWTAVQNAPDEPHPMTESIPTADEIKWAALIPQIPHYVLSTTLATAQWSNTRFLRSTNDVIGLMGQPGKDIYLVGGAQTVSGLVDAGLVHEIRLILHPLLANSGKALFDPITRRHSFALTNVRQLDSGRIGLNYEVADLRASDR